MIQSVGLTKQFVRTLKKGKKEEFYAVDHISFTANQGEILGILGPNGAGKTTLLRMLGSLMEPTEGHVVIEDREGNAVRDNRPRGSKGTYWLSVREHQALREIYR